MLTFVVHGTTFCYWRLDKSGSHFYCSEDRSTLFFLYLFKHNVGYIFKIRFKSFTSYIYALSTANKYCNFLYEGNFSHKIDWPVWVQPRLKEFRLHLLTPGGAFHSAVYLKIIEVHTIKMIYIFSLHIGEKGTRVWVTGMFIVAHIAW